MFHKDSVRPRTRYVPFLKISVIKKYINILSSNDILN